MRLDESVELAPNITGELNDTQLYPRYVCNSLDSTLTVILFLHLSLSPPSHWWYFLFVRRTKIGHLEVHTIPNSNGENKTRDKDSFLIYIYIYVYMVSWNLVIGNNSTCFEWDIYNYKIATGFWLLCICKFEMFNISAYLKKKKF